MALAVILLISGALLTGGRFLLTQHLRQGQMVQGLEATEQAFVAVESLLRFCGAGLPHKWSPALFSVRGRFPSWAKWGEPLMVMTREQPVSDGQWGDQLLILSPVATGVSLDLPFQCDANEEKRISLNGALFLSDQGFNQPARWFVWAGGSSPLYLSPAGSRKVKAYSAVDVTWPGGAGLYRLAAVRFQVTEKGLTASYYDESGVQPLVPEIDQLKVRRQGELLQVMVGCGPVHRERQFRWKP